MRTFRILSIDGGGLRGVVPLTILQKLEELTGKPVWQSFDLIAGTSTGGLIASALTIPANDAMDKARYSISDLLKVYIERGQEIFPPKKTWLGGIFGKVNNTINPRYSDTGIDKVFRDVLGETKLNDSLTHIMVCAYDLNNNMPLFFKTRSSKVNPMQNITRYDVCRATSAGPTYLPAFKLVYPNDEENPNRLCIDGGVFINNPALGALAELSKHMSEYIPKSSHETDIDYNKVFVLSIGTGTYSGQIKEEDAMNKGELFWATRISDIMMRGTNRATDYEMQEMMEKDNYLRLSINIEVEKYSEMDRADMEASQYLINETRRQVLDKQESMDKLGKWLVKSGLKSGVIA